MPFIDFLDRFATLAYRLFGASVDLQQRDLQIVRPHEFGTFAAAMEHARTRFLEKLSGSRSLASPARGLVLAPLVSRVYRLLVFFGQVHGRYYTNPLGELTLRQLVWLLQRLGLCNTSAETANGGVLYVTVNNVVDAIHLLGARMG